ncbi:MAG: (2Fe-2S)-binding protein, partial [Croceibacterium sp.]
QSIYRVAVTEDQQPGHLFVPMHFTDANSGGGRTGRLVGARTDPHSGQPAFKDTAAAATPFMPDWRGFLISRDPVQPDAAYWARARVTGGWLVELAGIGAVDVEALLPQGTRSEVADHLRGMRRIAVQGADGSLAAVLYLTRAGTLPDRTWIVAQFAAADAAPVELLAGRPAAPQPDRGPLVCLCHDIAEQQVVQAVRGGAHSVAAVGQCTRAGTNCGSCRPLIAKLIAQELSLEPAE